MQDFAGVIAAFGKPDTKLHALELAEKGDKQILRLLPASSARTCANSGQHI